MNETAKRKRVRVRAAIILPFATLFGIAFLWWFVSERRAGNEWVGPGLAGGLLPLVYFLTELVFGRSVPELAKTWDQLKGWQRGLLGCCIVMLLFGIIIAVALALGGAL